jgi:hypothetical protein
MKSGSLPALVSRDETIVVLDGDGAELWTHRIDNSPLNLGLDIEKAAPAPEVVLEGDVGSVLGGRRDHGGWRQCASGASARDCGV